MKQHTKSCWCPTCTKAKTILFRNSYMERIGLMVKIKPPTTPDALVPVRAHFRRQPNYLQKSPVLRELAIKLSNPYRKASNE
jgi:predicted amidophosphoribosyltransferase